MTSSQGPAASDPPTGLRRGVRLGIDVGSVRVGVARSDPEGLLAVPVATLSRDPGNGERASDLEAIGELVVEFEPLEILVGLPLGLDGTEGRAAEAARTYARLLAARLVARGTPTPIRLVDERMSTSQAQRGLRQAGRSERSSRSVIDQAAAVIIVQQALDTERSTGVPVGLIMVDAEEGT